MEWGITYGWWLMLWALDAWMDEGMDRKGEEVE